MKRNGQYTLAAWSSIVEARLVDVDVVIGSYAMMAQCDLRHCTIHVTARATLRECLIEECDTTIDDGAEEGLNYVEGGTWLDLRPISEGGSNTIISLGKRGPS